MPALGKHEWKFKSKIETADKRTTQNKTSMTTVIAEREQHIFESTNFN